MEKNRLDRKFRSQYWNPNFMHPNLAIELAQSHKIDGVISSRSDARGLRPEPSFLKAPYPTKNENPVIVLNKDLYKIFQILKAIQYKDFRFSTECKKAQEIFEDMELQTRYITENAKKLELEKHGISTRKKNFEKEVQIFQREADEYKKHKNDFLQNYESSPFQTNRAKEETQQRIQQLEDILNKINNELMGANLYGPELREGELKLLSALLQSIADFLKNGDRSSLSKISMYSKSIASAIQKLKENLNNSSNLKFASIYEKDLREFRLMKIILKEIERGNKVDLAVIKNEDLIKTLHNIITKTGEGKIMPNSIDERLRENIDLLRHEKEILSKDLEMAKIVSTKYENQINLLNLENKRLKDIKASREQDSTKRGDIFQGENPSLNYDLKEKVQLLQKENSSLQKKLDEALAANCKFSEELLELRNELKIQSLQSQIDPIELQKEVERKNEKVRILDDQIKMIQKTISSRIILKLKNLLKQFESNTANSLQSLNEKIDSIQKKVSTISIHNNATEEEFTLL